MAVDKTGSAPPPGAAVGEIRHGKGRRHRHSADVDRGDVTFDHGQSPHCNGRRWKWDLLPPPKLLADIKTGDKVVFEIDWDGWTGTITKIAKAP
ncbi:copper-binding protein [Sphingomonas koreensis]|nr:copper-binding protein [Sphingomonas koreensis]